MFYVVTSDTHVFYYLTCNFLGICTNSIFLSLSIIKTIRFKDFQPQQQQKSAVNIAS